MRLSFVSDANLVNADYRAYQPMIALERRGLTVGHNGPGEPRLHVAALLDADAVLIHRYVDAEIRHAVVHLREAGVGVVWDNDDDITSIPRSNPHYARFSGLNGRRLAVQLKEIVGLADVVTTPSEVLAAKYRELGASDVRVIENHVPDAFADVKPRKHDRVVVVWVAALEHQQDLQHLRLRETLDSLLATHAQVEVLSIGLNLGLRSPRYRHIRSVPFLELASTLASCDIGIAPLIDIPWNQARSNVKLKEYGSAGLAWLASPVGAYRGMGEREGGRLVAEDDWGTALEALVLDGRARQKLAKRAAKWAKGETIGRNVKQWEAALRDAAAAGQRRRAQAPAAPVSGR